jgi:hypothetical protein
VRAGSALDVEPGSKRIRQTVYYRDGENAPWKAIYQAFIDEGREMEIAGFDFDNKTMLVAGRFNGRDKKAVYLWDFAKNTVGEMLADHPQADVENVRFDSSRKKIVGAPVAAMKPSTCILMKITHAWMRLSAPASRTRIFLPVER